MPRITPIDPESITENVLVRFYSKTRKFESGCIEWTGALTPLGYGRFRLGDRFLSPHRLIFVIKHGKDIPFGMVVDHKCRNPRCLNIDHLELVSYAENTSRGVNKNAPSIRARLERNECVTGHDLATTGFVDKKGSVRCGECQRANGRARHALISSDPAWRARKNERMRLLRARVRAEKSA